MTRIGLQWARRAISPLDTSGPEHVWSIFELCICPFLFYVVCCQPPPNPIDSDKSKGLNTSAPSSPLSLLPSFSFSYAKTRNGSNAILQANKKNGRTKD
uniref:Uncharacterized protein n=1 Tax=Pyxicephalus adspersus TaxID=30357 RepID=A0AAV3B4G3_PYXAD|nr:TPA: hypothetical protein GDO54_006122 [Pyxicephalus adspersus]